MTAPTPRKPINWEDYEYGRSSRRDGSVGSNGSHVRFDASPPQGALPSDRHRQNGDGTNGNGGLENGLRHRGSSLSMRINSLAHLGGVNSLENFARSWQRAAGFYEIAPARSSFVVSDEQDGEGPFRRADEERGSTQHLPQHKSLLRQQLEQQGSSPESAVHEGNLGEDFEQNTSGIITPRDDSVHGQGKDIFAHAPHLASPYSDFGGMYGSLSSNLNDSSKRHAARLYREQQVTGVSEPDKEREPLLVKRVERDDGKFVNVVIGQSTLPQTVLNSVNVLIGIGLLSLPLGIKYAGWLVGLTFLLFSALVTRYTAGLLAKCLDVDDSLITFADVAYVSFGSKARIVTSILFSIELVAACVALVVLFADSLDVLIPGWGIIEWKIFCGVIMLPLCFIPLRLLSYSSLFGIGCCLGILTLIVIDGLLKCHTPGSLREPARTYLFPQQWSTLPLSFGLLMSPWGGHSVFPNIYRDMRHPYKYGKALQVTFGFTYLLDMSMAVVGLLMFGDSIRDEVTSNILLTPGSPKVISIIIVLFIAVIPLTKLPLNARPIISTVEIACGLDVRTLSASPGLVGMSGFYRGLLKFGIRVSTVIIITIIAILVPSFDRIMALMGSALCFTICIILPLAFYLKLFGNDISLKERVFDWFLIVICSIMAVVGTVWAFLPKSKIGAA